MSAHDLTMLVQALITRESLPDAYADTVKQTILPLAEGIRDLHQRLGRTVIIGIHGAQGTGKSTLTEFLQHLLADYYGLATASFSLDDIYLTREERETLADKVHPLLITRGVPGTHDLVLGQQTIDRLKEAGPHTLTPIPAFDKSRDDRAPEQDWDDFRGRAEVILVEGWCLGAAPEEQDEALTQPVNELERVEDADGHWRRYVNQQLQDDYQWFFGQLDWLIMLRAPSMACVLEWRTLQEHKLAERLRNAPNQGDGAVAGARHSRIMTDAQIVRFIMHYERITRTCLAEMPRRADVVIDVAEDHSLGLPQFRPTTEWH